MHLGLYDHSHPCDLRMLVAIDFRYKYVSRRINSSTTTRLTSRPGSIQTTSMLRSNYQFHRSAEL